MARKIIKRCLKAWFLKRLEYFKLMLLDIFINVVNYVLMLLSWCVLRYSLYYIKSTGIYNFVDSVSNIYALFFTFQFFISTIFILVKHFKLMMKYVSTMDKRMEEEIRL